MWIRSAGLAMVGVALAATTGWTQAVQLPTYHFFTVNTTVSVPDGGAAYLGGVSRGSLGSSEFGVPGAGRVFGNRAIGAGLGTSQMSVSATIIDHAEIDRALLAQAAADRVGGVHFDSAVNQEADFLSRHLARRDLSLPATSTDASAIDVSAIRRHNEQQSSQREVEAAGFLARGDAALQAEKIGVAKIYYQMALARATGELKATVAARLVQLGSARKELAHSR